MPWLWPLSWIQRSEEAGNGAQPGESRTPPKRHEQQDAVDAGKGADQIRRQPGWAGDECLDTRRGTGLHFTRRYWTASLISSGVSMGSYRDGSAMFLPLARQMGSAMEEFTANELEIVTRFMHSMVGATIRAGEEASGRA